jgi:hypothetical protein
VITPYDDFPIHQTSEPVAHPVSGDPNQYDRYFFNGYTADGSTFFAAAMGHYPNRGIIDAAFSVVGDGVQRSVFASGRMPLDRSTAVGPISVDVLEPMRRLRVAVGPNDFGIEASLTFEARSAVIEEPRNTVTAGTRKWMDSTRLTQWGSWSGDLRLDGQPVRLDGPVYGVRDRSWGQRGVGVQLPTNFELQVPQLFWLWAPLNFASFCTHLALFEYADGRRWLEQGLIVPVLEPGAPTWGGDADIDYLNHVGYDISWMAGTRQAAGARLSLDSRRNGPQAIELEPLLTFRMRGIGYTHPEWGHGSLHGQLEVGGESLDVDRIDPLDFSSIHIQSVVRATMGDEVGIGVLEQLFIGEHQPTGLTGLLDPAVR